MYIFFLANLKPLHVESKEILLFDYQDDANDGKRNYNLLVYLFIYSYGQVVGKQMNIAVYYHLFFIFLFLFVYLSIYFAAKATAWAGGENKWTKF